MPKKLKSGKYSASGKGKTSKLAKKPAKGKKK